MAFLSRIIRLMLLSALLAMGAASAWAQSGSAPAPGAYEAKLDSLLSAGDFAALDQAAYTEATDADKVLRVLNWLKAQQSTRGGSSYIAFLYSASLWRVAEATIDPTQAGRLKQGAVEQFVLAQLLIQTEGFQCADRAAPGTRLNDIKRHQKVLDHTKEMPRDDMRALARIILVSMIESFKLRENDVWMCRKEPDTIASILVPESNPTTRPEFIPYANWKDARHAILDKLASETDVKIENYRDDEHRMK